MTTIAPEDLQVHTEYAGIDDPVRVTVIHRPTGLASTGKDRSMIAARDRALLMLERLIAERRGIGA